VIPAIQPAAVECERHIDVQRTVQYAKNLERGRENSNDGVRFAFDIDFLTDEARIFTEAASPESVAQDNDLVMSDLFIFRKKCASELNLRAQQRQEGSRNGESLNTFRFVSPRLKYKNRQAAICSNTRV